MTAPAVTPVMLAPAPPVPTFNVLTTAAPTAAFGTREAQLNKVDDCNSVVFSVPAGSSLLLKLTSPPCHAYEERDLRWLHLLQAVAAVPSRQAETIAKLVEQSIVLIRSPKFKQRLELALRPLVVALAKVEGDASLTKRSLLALRMKDAVASFLRDWVKDPVDGFVLRKDHVVGGMRLDDLVATPVGAAYLRGYRRDDGFCVVVFPWGHGFVHLSKVEQLDVAIEGERRKRHHHEYLALEHQQLFEQVESLLDNYPPATAGDVGPENESTSDLAEYKALLEELQGQLVDSAVVEQDISFVRRVQALAAKLTKRQRRQSVIIDEDMEDMEEERSHDGGSELPHRVALVESEEESKGSGTDVVKLEHEDDPMQ